MILNKLLFFREGHSEKHLRDIAGIIKTSGSKLDRVYINRWAIQLDVHDVWQAVLDRLEGT